MPAIASDVLEFWFSDRARARWFASTPAFDDEIRSRFADVIDGGAAGALAAWEATSDGALALVIALDQFPRNIHRGTPRTFEYDAAARATADRAIAAGHDLAAPLERRGFFYLPFEHSESLADQDRSVELFSRLAAEHPPDRRAAGGDLLDYAVRHREIVQRFGRFPHRNAALGRASTAEEIAFLAGPRSSF